MSRPVQHASCVDVHGHGVPERFVEEVHRSGLAGVSVEVKETDGGRSYLLTYPGAKPLRPIAGIMLDFAGRTAWLDDRQVRTQLVAPWLDVHGQILPARDGAVWVRLLNDCMAEVAASSRGRLMAHAVLHLAEPAVAAAELERAHRELGMTGCMIPTDLPAGFLDEPRFDALWEAAAGLGVPVVLHPPTVAPSSPLFMRHPRLSTLGRVIDSTLAASALITSGVLDRHPNLHLVLVHGGGFLPYQVSRLDQAFEGEDLVPSEYLRRICYDTTLMATAAVRMLLETVGPARLMVGSDYAATPRQDPWAGRPLAENVTAVGANPQDTALVLVGTAQRLFKVAP
jgi:aminocarboxymuconate-semialdehyde decarboxylase